MAWTNIPGTDVDQDSPITQTLMTALRDNAQWAWESTWHPYDMAYPGDGNDGLIFDGTVAAATVVSPDFEDGFEYRFLWRNWFYTNATPRMELYAETSAAYYVAQAVGAGSGASITHSLEADITILGPRLAAQSFAAVSVFSYRVSPAGTVLSSTSALSYGNATVQKVLRARFSQTAGNIPVGATCHMFRRRELLS